MVIILPTDTCYGLAWEFNEQDYHEIYRLKWRNFTNPLAWVVRDYDNLKEYIEITDEQIDFLKSYHRPWSILGKRIKSYILPSFLDPETYQMISLRVASVCLCHREEWSDPGKQKGIPTSYGIASYTCNDETWKLNFPLFLTSANISGSLESKTLAEARGYFPKIVWWDGWICCQDPSDIFAFWDDNQLIYFRKNSR